MNYIFKTGPRKFTSIYTKFKTESNILLKYFKYSRNFSTNNDDKNSVALAYTNYDTYKSSATPIVIMHGLFGSKSNWNSMGKALNQETKRRIFILDARNHGESPHSSQMTFPLMAKDVKDFLKFHNIEKSILIGHSMGGVVMMCVALNYPNIVEKLVVIDVSPVRATPNLHTLAEIANTMLSIKCENSKTLTEARKHADEILSKTINSQAMRQFLLMNLVEKSPGNFIWRLNLPIVKGFINHISILAQILMQSTNKTFNGPTLMIAGSTSNYVEKEDDIGIKKIFPAAKLKWIEGAGHTVHADKPAEFLRAVTAFVDQ